MANNDGWTERVIRVRAREQSGMASEFLILDLGETGATVTRRWLDAATVDTNVWQESTTSKVYVKAKEPVNPPEIPDSSPAPSDLNMKPLPPNQQFQYLFAPGAKFTCSAQDGLGNWIGAPKPIGREELAGMLERYGEHEHLDNYPAAQIAMKEILDRVCGPVKPTQPEREQTAEELEVQAKIDALAKAPGDVSSVTITMPWPATFDPKTGKIYRKDKP